MSRIPLAAFTGIPDCQLSLACSMSVHSTPAPSYLTSSFSEHCPSARYIACSWNVIDARETLVMTINFNEGAQYFGTLLGILKDAATIGGCTGSDPSLFGASQHIASQCCTSQSGPYMESRVEEA